MFTQINAVRVLRSNVNLQNPPVSAGLAPGMMALLAQGAFRDLPTTLGHEAAGTVAAVGSEVAGISVDQLAASRVGLKTPVDSLALGIDPGIRGDHGFSGTYLSNISWRRKRSAAVSR